MTTQNAIDEVRQATADTSTDPARQKRSNAVIVTGLNLAQKKFARATKVIKTEDTSQVLTASTATLALPSNFICFDPKDIIGSQGGVLLNSQALEYTTVGALDKYDQGWRAAGTGIPEKFAFKDLDTLVFHPKPNATAAAYTLILRYVKKPTDLSASDLTATILNGILALVDYHLLIPYYAISMFAKIDGNSALADRYLAMWAAGVEEAKQELGDIVSIRGGLRAEPRWTAGFGRPPA